MSGKSLKASRVVVARAGQGFSPRKINTPQDYFLGIETLGKLLKNHKQLSKTSEAIQILSNYSESLKALPVVVAVACQGPFFPFQKTSQGSFFERIKTSQNLKKNN